MYRIAKRTDCKARLSPMTRIVKNITRILWLVVIAILIVVGFLVFEAQNQRDLYRESNELIHGKND